jgi:hypothetical protein
MSRLRFILLVGLVVAGLALPTSVLLSSAPHHTGTSGGHDRQAGHRQHHGTRHRSLDVVLHPGKRKKPGSWQHHPHAPKVSPIARTNPKNKGPLNKTQKARLRAFAKAKAKALTPQQNQAVSNALSGNPLSPTDRQAISNLLAGGNPNVNIPPDVRDILYLERLNLTHLPPGALFPGTTAPSGPNSPLTSDPALSSVLQYSNATEFPPHAAPTHLYLNFDGWKNPPDSATGQGEKQNIAAYNPTDPNREWQIQDILFRVSEYFAPFNVEVSRRYGDGNYDSGSNGNTTIFIGADSWNTNINNGASLTPNFFEDFPGAVGARPDRPFDSLPYHLAYVDPMYGTNVRESDAWIATQVAHEAGHTFGLGHVRSTGTDANGLPTFSTSNPPDIMSYDAPQARFLDTALPLTRANSPDGGGATVNLMGQIPSWLGTPLTTQNSFAYLSTVLGPRPGGGQSHVAHFDSIDPATAGDERPTQTLANRTLSGTIDRTGDYEVYPVISPPSGQMHFTIKAAPGRPHHRLDPVVLVYDNAGANVAYAHNGTATVMAPKSGGLYYVVVGSLDGNTSGGYTLTTTFTPWRAVPGVGGQGGNVPHVPMLTRGR